MIGGILNGISWGFLNFFCWGLVCSSTWAFFIGSTLVQLPLLLILTCFPLNSIGNLGSFLGPPFHLIVGLSSQKAKICFPTFLQCGSRWYWTPLSLRILADLLLLIILTIGGLWWCCEAHFCAYLLSVFLHALLWLVC